MWSRLPAEPPLIGRERQLEQLLKHLNSALQGVGSAVFIGGEAGVGKTRLVTEFLNLAKKKEARVLRGWCLGEAAIPYFPFIEAMNAYMSAASDARIKTAVTKQLGLTGWLRGEIAGESEARQLLAPQIEMDKTFEATAAALLQLSAHEPTILFLDDLQWADDLSLALIHYVARNCRNSRLLIIGAYRSEELIRTKEEELHPLEEAMFSMSREDLLTKMELGPLGRDDLPDLLRSVFRSEFDENLIEKLYRETEGNPLFLLETLNLLAEEGFLSERGGQWVLTAPLEKIGVPSKVQEVLIRRISRLKREDRKLLDVAAVLGRSFNADTLRRTMSLDLADVLEELVDIEQRHKLIHSIDSAFEFSHQKIREVIYDNLQGELRRVYHLKTASCLEQVAGEKVSDGYLADVAFHYVEGGAPEKAFGYLVRLGEKALAIYANVQAIEYLDKALEATQKTPSLATDENLVKIRRLRGRAWMSQDRKAKARDDFNVVLQIAEKIGDVDMIIKAHNSIGATYEAYFGEVDEAMGHHSTALEMARKAGNKRLEADSLRMIGVNLSWCSDPDEFDKGRILIEESYRILEELGDENFGSTNLGRIYSWKGEFIRAKELIIKRLKRDEELGNIAGITNDLFYLGMNLGGSGDYNDAVSTLKRMIQLAREYGRVTELCFALNTLGWIYHDLSNIELAMKYNNEALEVARADQRSRASGGVPSATLNLALDYLYESDYENAEKYFRETISLYPQHRMGTYRMQGKVILGRGEIALAKGDHTQALKCAEDALTLYEKADAKKYIAKGLKLKAEALAGMERMDEAIGLMEKALKLAQQVGNPPTLWQINHGFGLLFERRGDLQKASEHHAAAIALIESTASKLNDPSVKNTLLTSAQTKAIHDAYTRTISAQ
jgi:tetratricopeptide (TPR) repeat protein